MYLSITKPLVYDCLGCLLRISIARFAKIVCKLKGALIFNQIIYRNLDAINH